MELLKIGDTDNIEQLCNEISEKAPNEAEEIKKLASNFDFVRLLELLSEK
ncbi:MAG: hypothetical protein GY787_09615 [Alteromonadales bacterium]|nr:hypothetical protein [Alteromonadales bacterium]